MNRYGKGIGKLSRKEGIAGEWTGDRAEVGGDV